MKTYFLQLAAAALCAGLLTGSDARIAAQDLGSLGKQAQNLGGIGNLAGLAQKLHLSPQQLQRVMPILETEVPKLQSIARKTGLSTAQKTDQTKAVQKQSDSQLKSILSPKQFTSLQNFRSAQLQDVLKGMVPQ
ncbi:MAG TPA: hypothetical protein VJW20_11870 [Candidatus Angelobacter sp.]|nr:hypothetical protein [Candidatus Angelobacter sp.]